MTSHKKPLHKSDDFLEWLVSQKQFSRKVAGDIASRCRRIEAAFNIELNKMVVSKEKYDELFHRVRTDASRFGEAMAGNKYEYSTLRRALRLYAQFLVGDKVLNYGTGFIMRKPQRPRDGGVE